MSLPFIELAKEVTPYLQELIELHEKFITQLKSETAAVATVDVKVIQEVAFSKEVLLQTISETEYKRRRLIPDMSITELSEKIKPHSLEASKRLNELRQKLVELIDEAARLNSNNQSLIEKSLHTITQMKDNIIGDTAQLKDTYTAAGKKSASSNSKSQLLERKA